MEAYFPGKGLLAIFFFYLIPNIYRVCSKKSHIYHPSEIPQLLKYGEYKNVDLIESTIIVNICLLLRFKLILIFKHIC